MPKTFNNLWPYVVSWDNLVAAYHRCRRRKRFKADAVEFDFRWEENLLRLQHELTSGEYRPGEYRHFHIQDPKPRKISAAPFRDRIVHHAVVGVLEPPYERRFIHDSYACRRGKGTHRAIDRAQEYLRRFPFFLKTDIVKFFPCVDHEVLLTVLRRTIRDPRLLNLIERIIASGEGVLDAERPHFFYPGDDLFAALRPCGLPIGNLTSQFFANVLLDQIDHFIKERLRVRGYVRYADDLLLFGESKRELWDAHAELAKQLALLRLRLHPHKTHVAPTRRSVSFLGFRIGPSSRRLPQVAIRRFNRNLRRLRWRMAARQISPVHVRVSIRAMLTHLAGANSLGVTRRILARTKFVVRPVPGRQKLT